MGSELAVWLFDRHVGTLSIAKGRLHFAYEPTWLSHPQAIASNSVVLLSAAAQLPFIA